jgi:uncharacterized protein (DUF1330 family)
VAAYLIADIEVHDAAGYEEYRQAIPATLAAHGGRYLARGGSSEVLEGDWQPRRTVIVEFPSAAALKKWYNSPECQRLKAIRERTAKSRLVMIEWL